MKSTNPEQSRLERQWAKKENWYQWGPYLSERQWGTVREDYSADGQAWKSFPHEQARSRVYRWGEDGLGGISDDTQTLCFALALWNGNDPFLKERLFGLSNEQGNHGEDVKELYYYLDNTPTHSYMRMLYKYGQAAFPYKALVDETANRKATDPEFEILDTGLFDNNHYFDVLVEYAKEEPDDILIRLTITNRAGQQASLHVLPTLWFRNRWAFGEEEHKPQIERLLPDDAGVERVRASHTRLGTYTLHFTAAKAVLMTENETNTDRVWAEPNTSPFVKDAFHDAIVTQQLAPFDQHPSGTKCAPVYHLTMEAGATVELRLRLCRQEVASLGQDFTAIFEQRQQESDQFYGLLTADNSADDALIKRQAWAGLLWSKQYYHYNVRRWLEGDPGQVVPPEERWKGRNADWQHLNAEHIMVMPDKWEYPWFAAWDQAFQSIPMLSIDREFAKHQLYLHAAPEYQSPDGRLPAYEWDFSAMNPPLRAGISWLFYRQEHELTGYKDHTFLRTMFERLKPNFDWWTDEVAGKHDGLFQGGFMGLDNISLFDRNEDIPGGGSLDQADATAWMATYALYMLRIAVELAQDDPQRFEPLCCRYLDNYLRSGEGLQKVAKLWIDEQDPESDNGFVYDILYLPDGKQIPIPIRSLVGLAHLFVVMTLDRPLLENLPVFRQKVADYLAGLPSENRFYCLIDENPEKDCILFALLSTKQLERLSGYLFSEEEMLGPGGIRSLSKAYVEPFTMEIDGETQEIHYTPGESDSNMFGGNSNWRGPVWYPFNYFIVKALEEFGSYYADRVQIEFPKGSNHKGTLQDAAAFLAERMWSVFRPNEQGMRPCHGQQTIYATDPHFNDLILYYEHFDGDTSRGLGASHQTGWTALVTQL